MSNDPFTRREFSVSLASFFALGSLVKVRPFTGAGAARAEELSHNAEAIHQEVVINASRSRVYEALTDATRFTAVMALSPVPKGAPAQIAREEGGKFTLFGGYITGRHIELLRNQRIVQAWRSGSWGPGMFSIARFELQEQSGRTKIVFDHAGFPAGEGEHLASGWHANYWEPLRKYLV